jgi:ABC-type uncharacterized transport system ATPase subunit
MKPRITRRREHHRIKRVTVTGGFLDGLDVTFGDGLNCIIGPRGSGKTTLLELIRFGLDDMPGRDGDPLRTRIESIIASNLNGGRVELEVETKDGQGFSIARAPGEAPLVFDQHGHSVPGIKVRGGVLFQADVLSQNQVESIAEMPHYQLELIDRFRGEELSVSYWKIDEARNNLEANAAALLPLIGRKETLEMEIRELPVIEAKLAGLKTNGTNADAINRAYAEKALRDREDRVVNEAARIIREFAENTQRTSEILVAHFDSLFTDDLRKGPNGTLITKLAQKLCGCAKEVDQHLIAAAEALRGVLSTLEKQKASLAEAHTRQELAFLRLIEKHKEAMEKSGERNALEKRRNELMFTKHEIADIGRRIGCLIHARAGMLKKLSQLHDERFAMRSAIAKELTAKLAPAIRVRFEQSGDRAAYREHLESVIRGSALKTNLVAGRIAASIAPDQLVELVVRGDVGEMVERCRLSERQAQTVLSIFCRPENLLALEMVRFDDAPYIELFERGEYRESMALSTGQKCTAILPILLFESVNPLLIDQPEDNLDNTYIYETVVEALRNVKQSRQLIFVTHNPNIPVLGDAGLVLVMDSDEKKGRIVRRGTVDECKSDVVTLLEGGEEAFKARKERYHY